MGLAIFDSLKNTVVNTVNSQLGDQWREYFYCDSMDNNVLMTKGKRRVNNQKTSNKHGIDNIITNGSIIAVNEGQCMIIVENGRIAEFCAEPGQFIYDASTESTILYGNFKENVSKTWETFKKRATFGGDTGIDQRIYFFNTKEILDNPFGTASPIPFRVVDPNIALDMDTLVRCHGKYTFRIVDPILFYRSIAGNEPDRYEFEGELENQMKSDFMDALSPALGRISDKGIRYNQISHYPNEVKEALAQELAPKWTAQRGIALCSISISPMRLPEDVEKIIRNRQMTATLRAPGMSEAFMVESMGAGFKGAGSGDGSSMLGFAGMGMAMNTANTMGAGGLLGMGQPQMAFAGMASQQPMYQQPMQGQQMYQQPMQGQQMYQQPMQGQQMYQQPMQGQQMYQQPTQVGGNEEQARQQVQQQAEQMGEMTKTTEKPAVGWTCACGAVNKGKFCPECGTKKPADAPLYKCDKCGWEPEDPKNPPKFCPECGDPFDDADIQ